VIISILAGLLACSEEPAASRAGSEDTAAPKSSGGDPCVNTFEVDTLPPYQADFGTTPPTREEALPLLLSAAGLYADIATKDVHPAVLKYVPQFSLWSDGADKERWVYIPECDSVDATDMDSWSMPVGTRLFKEFSIDGVRVETRLVERIGTGPRDFAYASYQWDDDEADATRVDADGIVDAHSSGHDIPSRDACHRCHGGYALGGGLPSRALGFSAVQLSDDVGRELLEALVADGRLSRAPDDIRLPGDETAQAALGYLHANCGNCHNDSPDRIPQVDLSLWLGSEVSTVEDSAAMQTAVDVPNLLFSDQHVSGRIVSGSPDESSVLYRMAQRGNTAQMPPLASEHADEDGLAIVRAWIESLP
jgi:hypothetical protein